VSAQVVLTGKAVADFEGIARHVTKYGNAVTARRIVKALLAEARRLGQDHFHRLGEEVDGHDGPPAREVHRWVCLAGRYELHYEVLPAYSDNPTSIAILRAWDTRQDR
jgi:plasmid stabilization system protein ParE